jgi:phosphomannomutase/phosphoglucomutase
MVKSDKIVALFAQDRLKDDGQTVVYDQKCSRCVPEVIESAGGRAVMEKSGHTFIKTTFIETDAVYAGELSGHHFFRSLPQGDDGLIASFYLAEILLRRGTSLSTLAGHLPDYPITPDIRLPMPEGQARGIIQKLIAGLQDEAVLSLVDGVRAEFPDGWGIARESVTEALLTLRFEGVDDRSLKRIMSRFKGVAPELGRHLRAAGY